jgi:hypothetical protein
MDEMSKKLTVGKFLLRFHEIAKEFKFNYVHYFVYFFTNKKILGLMCIF